jgi:hypothetical protein
MMADAAVIDVTLDFLRQFFETGKSGRWQSCVVDV